MKEATMKPTAASSRTVAISQLIDELASDIEHALRPTASMTVAERNALTESYGHICDAATAIRRARMAARKAKPIINAG